MTRFGFVLIIATCIGICVGIVFAQDNALNGGTVRGRITDTTEAQNPIEAVEIKIFTADGTEFITKTDANGDYKHAGLPAGRYLINISKKGYGKRIGKPVTVVNGGDHFVPLKMSKEGAGFFRDIFVNKRRVETVVKQRIRLLLQLVGESLGERYSLNRDDIKSLRQSVSKSVDTALKQVENVHTFDRAAENSNTALLEALLSHPECKVAFAEHLDEAQLQDYIDSIRARRQQDRQASARLITGLLSRELSLTTNQHENVEQLLIGAARNESFPTSISVLGINSQDAVNLLHYRLKISLDGILSQTQSEVWQVLVTREVDKSGGEGHAEIFAKAETGIRKAVAAGEITEKQAETRRDALKKVLSREGDITEPQEWEKRLAEAKLVAHTELLGHLTRMPRAV